MEADETQFQIFVPQVTLISSLHFQRYVTLARAAGDCELRLCAVIVIGTIVEWMKPTTKMSRIS